MSQNLRRVAYFLGAILIILYAIHYVSTSDIRSLTSDLPPIDRVEVELVHVNGETIDRVIAAKTLTNSKAQDFRISGARKTTPTAYPSCATSRVIVFGLTGRKRC